jgi:hypothetical protein
VSGASPGDDADLAKVIRTLDRLIAINDEPRPGPPRAAAAVDAAFEALGLQPPELLVQLYARHDGIGYLDAFLGFLDLDSACDLYETFHDEDEPAGILNWPRTWFPVLSLNGDVHVVVDLATGSMHAVDPEADTIRQIAAHWRHYLDALDELLASGGCRRDEEGGGLAFAPDLWGGIAERHGVRSIGDD